VGRQDPSLLGEDRGGGLLDRRQEPAPVLQALGQHQGGKPAVPVGEDVLIAAAVAGPREVEIEIVGQFGQGLCEEFFGLGHKPPECAGLGHGFPRLAIGDARPGAARLGREHGGNFRHPGRVGRTIRRLLGRRCACGEDKDHRRRGEPCNRARSGCHPAFPFAWCSPGRKRPG